MGHTNFKPWLFPELALHMNPSEKYQAELARGELLADEAQQKAVMYLQDLYERILESEKTKKKISLSGLLTKSRDLLPIFSEARKAEEPVRGLYFWGGVGRGKTWLLDIFFDSLPIEAKLRLHFHRFMQKIHYELRAFQGQADPLIKVAENLAGEYRVICLDEFFVKDITDAMILAGLLDALFKRNVILVTTSNIEPKHLYQDGLQRARFLPAIALLEKYTVILNVDGGIDYRLRALKQAELYHCPLGGEAEKSLWRSFLSLAPETYQKQQEIEILGRQIKTVVCADDVVWFDFYDLCDGPRSQNDYIELAKIYHAVLISQVPVMSFSTDDLARRFINLVDEFYDRNVKLIISAEADIANLYQGGTLNFEFERTRSRLLEMQSHEYLARAHRP